MYRQNVLKNLKLFPIHILLFIDIKCSTCITFNQIMELYIVKIIIFGNVNLAQNIRWYVV